MTAQELGNLPADEMTIRQRMTLELAAAQVGKPNVFNSASEIATGAVNRADALLHELVRVR